LEKKEGRKGGKKKEREGNSLFHPFPREKKKEKRGGEEEGEEGCKWTR